MSYKVAYNAVSRVIEVKAKGEFTLDQASQMALDISRLAREKKCSRVLSDFLEATIHLTTLEIFNLPKMVAGQYASQQKKPSEIKRALVIERSADSEFYETVSVNAGQITKVFKDRDEALRWLLE